MITKKAHTVFVERFWSNCSFTSELRTESVEALTFYHISPDIFLISWRFQIQYKRISKGQTEDKFLTAQPDPEPLC